MSAPPRRGKKLRRKDRLPPSQKRPPRPKLPFECFNDPNPFLVAAVRRLLACLLKIRDCHTAWGFDETDDADVATRRQLNRMLYCQAIKNIARGQRVKTVRKWGGFLPLMMDRPGRVVRVTERADCALFGSGKMEAITAAYDTLAHLVFGHERFWADDTQPRDVWHSAARLEARVDALWRVLSPVVSGGLTAMEVDRFRDGQRRGIWIHAHLVVPVHLCMTAQQIERIAFWHWDASRRGRETNELDLASELRDEPKQERLLRYIFGVTSLHGKKLAKHLDGFARPVKSTPALRRKWNRKGQETPRQLWLRLAWWARPDAGRDVRWRGMWVHTTRIRSEHR